jgi:hypothetical protein
MAGAAGGSIGGGCGDHATNHCPIPFCLTAMLASDRALTQPTCFPGCPANFPRSPWTNVRSSSNVSAECAAVVTRTAIGAGVSAG